MHQKQMFPLVREKTKQKLNGYLQSEVLQKHMDDYIVASALGDDAGVTGALLLGWQAGSDRKC